MSQAAEQYVQAFVHPKVKGGARRLLEVIASQIPDGQTMTPAITIPELTALMGHGDNAARRSRRDLVKVGVVRIVGGGQGQVSRYELMLLPDATGDDPALPLIGATPPPTPPRVRRPRPHVGPDLWDLPAEGERTVENIVQNVRSWRRYFVRFVRSTRWIGAVLRTFCTMLRSNFVQNVRSSPLSFRPRPHQVLDIDDARARDVHTFKNVHTHGAAPLNTGPPATETPGDPTRPPIVHPWHAWCGPLVCVPKELHLDWRRKHPEAWLFAFYARTHAATPVERLRLVVDEFKFWRVALAAELTPQASGAAPKSRAAPSSDLYARAIEERRQRQGSGFS